VYTNPLSWSLKYFGEAVLGPLVCCARGQLPPSAPLETLLTGGRESLDRHVARVQNCFCDLKTNNQLLPSTLTGLLYLPEQRSGDTGDWRQRNSRGAGGSVDSVGDDVISVVISRQWWQVRWRLRDAWFHWRQSDLWRRRSPVPQYQWRRCPGQSGCRGTLSSCYNDTTRCTQMPRVRSCGSAVDRFFGVFIHSFIHSFIHFPTK